MIRIQIELVPGGVTHLRRSIASVRISNLSDLADRSDYGIDVMDSANPLAGTPPRIASAKVFDHDRRQSVWALLAKVVNAIDGADFVEL
jgi:hypothetical protein